MIVFVGEKVVFVWCFVLVSCFIDMRFLGKLSFGCFVFVFVFVGLMVEDVDFDVFVEVICKLSVDK